VVAPGAPRQIAAEATNETTIIVTWAEPEDTGDSPIIAYNIFRGLNGAAITPLTAVGDVLEFTDTSLTARDQAAYQVEAVNTTGPGPKSDTASSTTTTSAAQTLKELLFDNWSLTGLLDKNVVGDMTEPVRFFDRGQVPGNKYAKAITVQKINAIGEENLVEHPKFFEQSDIFEIGCFLQVIDSGDDRFSQWIDLLQQMTSEVTRILQTEFSPSTNTGVFFRATTDWTRDDTFFPDDPELSRTLRFTLTRILSNDPTVFIGYPNGLGADGVLVFDTSASQGDDKPTSDYSYEQVTQITTDEGWAQLPYLTKDKTKGVGVAQYGRGLFSGTFSALMFAKKDDIVGTTTDKIQNIYKPQTETPIINQTAEVVLLQSNINTESTPVILTVTGHMKINRITKVSQDEQLVTYRLDGTLTEPSGFGLS